MDFFQLPEGYSFSDVDEIINHSFVDAAGAVMSSKEVLLFPVATVPVRFFVNGYSSPAQSMASEPSRECASARSDRQSAPEQVRRHDD